MRMLALTVLAVVFSSPLHAQQTVPVVRAVRGALAEKARLPGRVLPDAQLSLRARVTGYLTELPVDIGATVKQGDLLARLHVPDLESALRMAAAATVEAAAAIADAEAGLAVAKADAARAEADTGAARVEAEVATLLLQRRQALAEKRGATQEEVEEAVGRERLAQARVEAAMAAVAAARARVDAAGQKVSAATAGRDSKAAALDAAQAQLAFAELRCPFLTATVVARRLDPGALVHADDTVLLELQQVDKVRLEIRAPERIVSHVRAGTQVDITFDAYADAPRSATITRVAGALDASGTMLAQIDLRNDDGALLPGMFANVQVLLRSSEAAITIPSTALRVGAGGKRHVVLARDGRAQRVEVETGADDGTRIEITRGLDDGDAVITGPAPADGAAVRALESGGER